MFVYLKYFYKVASRDRRALVAEGEDAKDRRACRPFSSTVRPSPFRRNIILYAVDSIPLQGLRVTDPLCLWDFDTMLKATQVYWSGQTGSLLLV